MIENKINVRALKGAPLSIVIVLMLQRRSVSHALLCQETGYSDKTVTQGLEYLISNQIVTRTGHTGFQLTGENYQLPLYWSETIEPVDPSPALDPAALPLPDRPAEKFLPENSESENVKITTLEKKIEDLTARIEVLEAEKRKNYESEQPEIVNSSLINNQSNNTDTYTDKDSLIDSVISDYENHGRGCLFTRDQLQELARLANDPDVLEFVLPRASDFESAKKWVKDDMRHLKYHLLKRFGIVMPALQRITDNKDISPWQIDYQYWHWYLEDQVKNPNYGLGWAVKKIEMGYDVNTAETSGPLQYQYL